MKSGHLAGAGLDVLEGERMPRGGVVDYTLIDMPNVIVTPHIAFYSKEAEVEIIKITSDNISKFVDGKPQNLV